MATKESSLEHGIIWLLLHFDWKWVALYVSDNRQGELFLQHLKAEMIKKDICVAFTEKLSATTGLSTLRDFNFMNRIRVSSANVYILSGAEVSIFSLKYEKEFYLISGKVLIMINVHSSQWESVFSLIDKGQYFFHGSLLFSSQEREIPGFKQFLKTVNPSQYPEDFYFGKLWISFFSCSLPGSVCGKIGDCPSNSSLEFVPSPVDMMTVSDSSFLIYHAVYMVAQVLHEILLKKIQMESPGNVDQPVLLPWQVKHSLEPEHASGMFKYCQCLEVFY
ncbi:Vomeronasal type-2 receptor 26 [Tupaia chinensis]|uniref:Vomeronasal type-2 receptor 26 n=1 Tax=Tupaia chinensis TaxID=246437 RepID=L9LC49_TUPCH|nr:Vomeronasal type-2 receptor 26 [Tupaia chinensis]